MGPHINNLARAPAHLDPPLGTSTTRVLGIESCYCESDTNLKEYF